MDRSHARDDPEATAVRPALADDLFRPGPAPADDRATAAAPTPGDDDLLADEEFMAPGGRKPSWITRLLLALLICAVGVFAGAQLGKLVGGSAAAGTGAAGSGQSRRFGPPRAGSASAGSSATPRSTVGSSAPAVVGQVTSTRTHSLVVRDQQAVSHTVTFTDDTTVTKAYGHRAVGTGDAVTVFGSRAADGSVNATSIVVR